MAEREKTRAHAKSEDAASFDGTQPSHPAAQPPQRGTAQHGLLQSGPHFDGARSAAQHGLLQSGPHFAVGKAGEAATTADRVPGCARASRTRESARRRRPQRADDAGATARGAERDDEARAVSRTRAATATGLRDRSAGAKAETRPSWTVAAATASFVRLEPIVAKVSTAGLSLTFN